jgi:hypothetical protein
MTLQAIREFNFHILAIGATQVVSEEYEQEVTN